LASPGTSIAIDAMVSVGVVPPPRAQRLSTIVQRVPRRRCSARARSTSSGVASMR
jgi:DNA-binding transcriptional regulator YdaS (Cro superfamily)